MGPLKTADKFRVFLEFAPHSKPVMIKISSVGLDRFHLNQTLNVSELRALRQVRLYLNVFGEWKSHDVRPVFPLGSSPISELLFSVSAEQKNNFERDFALAWC